MNFDEGPSELPHCPQCKSLNVTRADSRTFILAALGGALGGALMALFVFSEKGDRKSVNVGTIIFGMFSGATAGFGFGRGDRNAASGRRYLCLDCFHFFTYFDHFVE